MKREARTSNANRRRRRPPAERCVCDIDDNSQYDLQLHYAVTTVGASTSIRCLSSSPQGTHTGHHGASGAPRVKPNTKDRETRRQTKSKEGGNCSTRQYLEYALGARSKHIPHTSLKVVQGRSGSFF